MVGVSAPGEGRAWGVEDLPLLSRWFVPVTWRVQMRTQHLVLLAGTEEHKGPRFQAQLLPTEP